jgi:hypothetical protein
VVSEPCARTKGALLAILAACAAAGLETIAPQPSSLRPAPMWFETESAGAALRFLGNLVPALPFCIVYGIVTGSLLDDRAPGPILKAFLVVVLTVGFASVFIIVSPSLGCYLFAVSFVHAIATAVWRVS